MWSGAGATMAYYSSSPFCICTIVIVWSVTLVCLARPAAIIETVTWQKEWVLHVFTVSCDGPNNTRIAIRVEWWSCSGLPHWFLWPSPASMIKFRPFSIVYVGEGPCQDLPQTSHSVFWVLVTFADAAFGDCCKQQLTCGDIGRTQ